MSAVLENLQPAPEEMRPPVVVPTVQTVSLTDDTEQFAQVAEAVFADDADDADADDIDVSPLSSRLLREFNKAEQDRRPTEERWLKDLRQYRGRYDPEVEKDLANRSKAFVRKTRVKVKTLDSRVADLQFPAGSEKNWDVGPTPVPTISAQMRAAIEQRLAKQANGQPVPPKVMEDAVLPRTTTGRSSRCRQR
jgi:hypothetical protein